MTTGVETSNDMQTSSVESEDPKLHERRFIEALSVLVFRLGLVAYFYVAWIVLWDHALGRDPSSFTRCLVFGILNVFLLGILNITVNSAIGLFLNLVFYGIGLCAKVLLHQIMLLVCGIFVYWKDRWDYQVYQEKGYYGPSTFQFADEYEMIKWYTGYSFIYPYVDRDYNGLMDACRKCVIEMAEGKAGNK